MQRLSDLPERDLERLSAYLDGELAGRDLERLESRLQAEPGLRAALDELRAVTRWMAALPARRAPRSFTLRPEMIRQRAAVRAYPRLQLATALAAIAFAVTFGLEFYAGSAPMARGSTLQSDAALAPGPAEGFAAAPAEEAAPAAADAMLESAATADLSGVETEPAVGEVPGGTPVELRDLATEAPAVKEALPESAALADGSAGGESATAAPTPTCAPCASRMATQSAPAAATEAPMMALVAPEGASPGPEAELMDAAALAEAPAPVEQEPAAPPIPTPTAAEAGAQNLMAATAPEVGAVPPAANAVVVTGEDQASRGLAELPAQTESDEPAVPPAPGHSGWTPLRMLQIGLACVMLILASLTVWARQQR